MTPEKKESRMQHLLHLPHHDGSALYVDNPHPALGDSVMLRVRVPKAYPLRGLYVRSVRDGEPRIEPAAIAEETANEQWWQVAVLMQNPVTHYRFLLDGPDGQYAWLTASGVSDRDVTDAHDFQLSTFDPPPAWANDAIVYEVFLDRFAQADRGKVLPAWATGRDWYDDPVVDRGPDAPQHIYGGDLAGIEQHLDHIVALGCTVIYLTPFFEAPSNHRYNASTFDEVDPILGGNAALASLTAAAHARGLRVLGDLTTNHTGDEHPWFRKAQADPTCAEAEMYFLDDGAGYVSWMDVPSLPKLDWSSPELRSRMIEGPASIAAKWLREPYSLDGWRVDVVNMTGRYRGADHNREVGQTMRATMRAANPDALLVAEHGHDYTRDIGGDSWHSTMNYAGFLRPVWQWLVDPDTPVPDFLGVPVRVPRKDAIRTVETMRDVVGSVPWQVTATNFNLIASHDTPRFRTIAGDPALVAVAAGLLFTLPGIPMVFSGDEIGLSGVNGEDSRRPFPWDRPASWDTGTLETYRSLIAARTAHPALRSGGLRWAYVTEDVIVYLRESAEERLLICLARAAAEPVRLPAAALGLTGSPAEVYGGQAAELADGLLCLHPQGPSVGIWSLR